jgi:hypothetical protein
MSELNLETLTLLQLLTVGQILHKDFTNAKSKLQNLTKLTTDTSFPFDELIELSKELDILEERVKICNEFIKLKYK